MKYPKYQATEETAIQKAHQLVNRGIFAFEIYQNERPIMSVNLYKNEFRGRAMESLDTKRYLEANPDIWSAFYEHYKEINGSYNGWKQHTNSFSFFYLYNYLPMWEFGSQIGTNEAEIRRLIYDFKFDKARGKKIEDHRRGVDFFVPKVERVLRNTFGNDLKDIVLMCVPASTALGYAERNGDFSEKVCRDTGMMNAMSHVKYIKDGTKKHCGGGERPVVELDRDFFKGKSVVLFDDVITRGESIYRCINDVISAGGRVLGAICLGKTVHNRDLANPYDEYLRIA